VGQRKYLSDILLVVAVEPSMSNEQVVKPTPDIDPEISGFVYVLSNAAMPGFVKIGQTTENPLRRARDLFTTGLPVPFRLERALFVFDRHTAERAVFEALGPYRISAENREFFKVSVETAAALVSCVVEQLIVPAVHCDDQERLGWLSNDVERLKSELTELKTSTAAQDIEIRELRSEVERLRESERKYATTFEQVKRKERAQYILALNRAERAEALVRAELGEGPYAELERKKRREWDAFRLEFRGRA